jgi:dynein heavy chain
VDKYTANTLVVSCMNPTAGSFVVNPRLQRWCTTFAAIGAPIAAPICMPGPASLLTIYHISLAFPDAAQEITTNLSKTATNFHYGPNVRQGLLVAQATNFCTTYKVVHLWLRESWCVNGGRLVSGAHISKFLPMPEAQSKKSSPAFNVAKFFAKENAEPLIPCYFADHVQEKINDQDNITSIDTLNGTLTGALDEYDETTNAAMPMKHVCCIVRIVQNEGRQALLVGVGGSGKQSPSRLAAFIHVSTVKQIVISSTYMYGVNERKEDLKWMYNLHCSLRFSVGGDFRNQSYQLKWRGPTSRKVFGPTEQVIKIPHVTGPRLPSKYPHPRNLLSPV